MCSSTLRPGLFSYENNYGHLLVKWRFHSDSFIINLQAILCVNSSSSLPNIHVDCKDVVGYLAAYRVCIAVASFFLLMSAIMICVRSSKDPRAYLQNGFWFFKWLFVIGLAVAFFFIPDGSNRVFSRCK